MNQMDYNFDIFYKQWTITHSIVNILGILMAIWLDWTLLWLIAILVSFLVYIINLKKFIIDFPLWIGYPNLITCIRLIIILYLGFTFTNIDSIILLTIFLLTISMDGLDGYLARKLNQCSKAGEKLDMETDSFLVLLLSWIHYSNHDVNWWILIPGGLKYFYEFSFFWLKEENQKLPSKKIRSTIAVIFFLSLLLPFLLTNLITLCILIISSFLITCSFSISLISRIKNTQQVQAKN